MTRVSLSVLGGFELALGSGAQIHLPTRKAQALLAYLAIHSGHAHPRDKLAALLWGDVPDAQARVSLRQALSLLGKALDEAPASCLVTEARTIALAPGGLEIDVTRFEAAAGEGTPEALERAVELYRGDLLEGLVIDEDAFESWLLRERERLREIVIEALGRLLAHHQAPEGSVARAIQTADRLLALDPCQEAVHRTLMRLYARQGRRGAALKQYQICVSVLQRELRAEPEAETKRLYQEVLQQRSRDVEKTGAGRAPTGAVGAEAIVGRDAEMGRLREALDEVTRGHGRVVMVVGEAGVGKTSVLRALAAEAGQRGARVLPGRSYESEQILPFGPWVDALRTGQVVADEALLGAFPPVWRSELARLFPEARAAGLPSPSSDQRQLFESVVGFLEHLAALRPVMVLLEDLHWADEMTARLLSFLGRRIKASAVLVVVTAREEELADASALRGALDELRRDGHLTELRLAPLSAEDTATLVRSLSRVGSDPEAVTRLGARIWRLSEGNPFVVVEILRALGEASALPGSADTMSLPERVRDVIARRLERLSDEGRTLAAVAAVIGREFEFSLLARAAEVTEREAAEGLEELVRRRILHGVEERFDFTHDRIGEVVASQLLPARRKVLHGSVARALEALNADNLEPHATALGVHYREAESWDKAIAYLRQAGGQAARRSAHREAVECFSQALAMVRKRPDTAENLAATVDLCFSLRGALLPLGEFDAIFTCLQEAEAAVRQLDDKERIGRAALYMSSYFWTTGHPADARRCAEDAVAIAAARKDSTLRTNALTLLGGAWQLAGDHTKAEECFRTSIDALEIQPGGQRLTGGGVSPATTARSFLAWSLAERGLFGQALRIAAESVRIAKSTERRFTIIQTEWGLAYVHLVKGDFGEAARVLERNLAMAREWDIAVPVQNQQCFLGTAYVRTGRVGEGLALLREGVTALEAVGLGGWLASYIVRLGEGWLLAGETAQAQRSGERALAMARARGQRAYEAWALWLVGEATASTQPYLEGMAIAEELGMRPLVAHCHAGLGRLSARTGDDDEGRSHLAAARAMYGEMAMTAWLLI